MQKLSKKEISRRNKISIALKKFHKEKKAKETLRRKRISISLKKFHAEKRKIENAKPKPKPKKKPTSTRKPTPKTKPKRTNKKKPQTKKKARKTTEKFEAKRKRVKVKTFPKKGQKDNFFFSDKKVFSLKRKINVVDKSDIDRVSNAIDTIRPDLNKFFKESKGKKRNKLMNLGYQIKLEFRSKDGKSKNVIETTSFTPSFKVSKSDSIDNSITGLVENIDQRFNDYLKRSGFFALAFSGVEAEMQN